MLTDSNHSELPAHKVRGLHGGSIHLKEKLDDVKLGGEDMSGEWQLTCQRQSTPLATQDLCMPVVHRKPFTNARNYIKVHAEQMERTQRPL